MSERRFSFKKKEHLCSEIAIDMLFTKGKSFVKYPFRITYLPVTSEYTKVEAQILISVPKKRFKRAVKRNLIKRKIREAYRLNKHLLVDELKANNQQLMLAFIYLPTEILNTADFEKGMQKGLKQIVLKTSSNEEPK